MNIYWCYDPFENWGVFVIAKTRGQAKNLACCELDIEYTEVRSTLTIKDVKETKAAVIDVGSPLLKKYGLEYSEPEEE